MKKLYIVGAGGFGREVYAWLCDWCNVNPDWIIVGFVNDIASALDEFPGLPPIVSTIDGFQPQENAWLVCAIADPVGKKDVVKRLRGKEVPFFTLIHPSVIVGQRAKIGEGVVICPRTVVSSDLHIGDFATINSACTIGHDTSIGAYSTLSGHCDVTGGVVLDEGVFMGSHAVVLPKGHVGHGASVGAGSVVLRKVAPGETVFGVPAKRISR
ncbi:MAG TPA: acetyltransferase [Eoetvoesiella sp.]|uniref:acetyltransferase n=1 Tax=Eoetvoesiella sp. TaxID=1966355 RepID=UPI002C5949F9|nr:acetyltransferase [Eoetvoesiella sp.]HWK61608.1 acetyltransferase [Eoetvoesiella sp.]